MTVAYWCVLTAILLPYFFGPLGQLPGMTFADFKEPRRRQPTLTGWRGRSNAAHLNGFEIIPGFAAAVIIAQLSGLSQGTIDILALAFIGTRILHGGFYIANQAIPRTIAWASGIACIVALFVNAA